MQTDGGMGVKKKKNGWSLSEQCWRWRYHRLHGIFFYCKSLNFQLSCFSFTVQYPIFFLVLPVQPGKLRYKKRYKIAMFLYQYWLHWYIWWRERTGDATVKGKDWRRNGKGRGLEAIFGFQQKILVESRFANRAISKSQREIAFPETRKSAYSKTQSHKFCPTKHILIYAIW